MTTPTLHGVVIKLFVGCKMNSEIRMHLTASPSWKLESSQVIGEVRFGDDLYVGKAFDSAAIPLSELRACCEEVTDLLHKHCPILPMDQVEMVAFPQVYLA